VTGEDGGEEAAERETAGTCGSPRTLPSLGAARALALEAEEQADQERLGQAGGHVVERIAEDHRVIL
jgi:hypothetical protein